MIRYMSAKLRIPRLGVGGSRSANAGWFHRYHRARRHPLRPTTNQVAVAHDADECHDETVLRLYGGHMIRVPFSLEEVLRWFG